MTTDELLAELLAEVRGLRGDLQTKASPPAITVSPGDLDAAEIARLAGSSFRS